MSAPRVGGPVRRWWPGAGLAVAVALAGAGCGLRVDAPTTTAGPAVRADTAPAGRGPATSAGPTPTMTPTTAAPSSTTTTTAAPSTTTSSSTSTTAAPTTTAPAGGLAAFCDAAGRYGADDLLGLGRRVVADPAGFLAAYETMADEAPDDLAPLVEDMGPLSRQVVTLVKMRQITTPEGLQAWLATTAPRAELEQWVLAQQQLVPQVGRRC